MSAKPNSSAGASERDIFLGALDKTPAERADYLKVACGKDREMRQRIDDLLSEQDALGGFLETPALTGPGGTRALGSVGPHGTQVAESVTERPGDRIGRYKLLQAIGEGGCGVVYMAEQEEPVRRRVALKVIKLGMDTKSVIARFEAERQALAMMDHSNIAKVFDAGATATGRPYFVMELVRGIRITDYCDQNKLKHEERLTLFIQVCHAIQHAHQKGIIHRDIKPSNILVTLHDGVPVPKVIDFGIAKATEQRLTEKTLFTEFQSFIGTPAYTSPEQAEMSGLDIDTRSDIYSLGVLLYEMLTGRTPFDPEHLLRSGLDEMRRIIREEEPVRPSTRLSSLNMSEATALSASRQSKLALLMEAVRGDLDWIVMKCLEKDRTRRYATTNDLAEDIQRYLTNEPVLARPPSNVYRLQKMLRRNRGAFSAAAAIAVTLVVGATLSTWLAIRATKAEHDALASQKLEASLRHQAEQDKSLARLNEYVADINLAQQSLSAGNFGRAVQLLNKHLPKSGEADLRGFEWRYLWSLSRGDDHVSLPAQRSAVSSVAISPDGERLAIGLRDRFSVWHLKTRTLLTNITKGALSLAFHPDGRRLFTASGSTVRSWNTRDWSEEHMLANSGVMALSADGRRLATAKADPRGRSEATVWDTSSWEPVSVIADAQEPIALSPDGRHLACGSAATNLLVWTLDGSRPEVVLKDSADFFSRLPRFSRNDRSLVFSPDGKSVIGARNTLSSRGVFVLSVWNAMTGEETDVMPADAEHIEHAGTITGMAFSPDGGTLATASMDHSIRLWDFPTRQSTDAIQGHLTEVLALAFAPDGQTIVSGAKDGEIKIWSAKRQPREDIISGPRHPVGFSKDSAKVLALSRDLSTGLLVDLATRETERRYELNENRRPEQEGRPPARPDQRMDIPNGSPPSPRPEIGREGRPPRFLPFRIQSLAASSDVRWLARGRDDGMVEWIDTGTMQTNLVRVSDRPVRVLALAPDGQSMITRGWEHGMRKWDLRSGTNAVWTAEGEHALFSPDGKSIAVAGRRDVIQIWDAATLTLRASFESPGQMSFGFAVAFSANSRMIALPAEEDSVGLWDVNTGKLLGTFTGHKQGIKSVAFSPDGRTLATASDDSTLKLWNVASQQEVISLRHLGAALTGLMFSPDGCKLIGGSGALGPNGGLRLYRAASFAETDAPQRITNAQE